MRKILFALALALVAASGLRADFGLNDQNGVQYGFTLFKQAAIGEDSLDGQYCTDSFVATPQVNVVAGEPVVYVSGGTGDVEVSGTATLGDVNFAGYAITSAFANSTSCPTNVQVCTCGTILANVAVSTTIGESLVTSADDISVAFNNTPVPFYGTPGCTLGNITATTVSALTSTAALTVSSYTAVSRTAFNVGRAVQNVTVSGGAGTVLVHFPF